VLFAALVAFGGWYVQFRLFRTNGLLWSLAGCSMFVPLLNRLAPGLRYVWPGKVASGFSRSVDGFPNVVASGFSRTGATAV
jgi:hypothetical protein